MKRVCIVCEGQTEVNFVQQVLTPYFIEQGIVATPRIIQAPSGRHRGGRVTIERLVDFMAHEYYGFDVVTSLVDFYGFKGAEGLNKQDIEQQIQEGLRSKGLSTRRTLPYVQRYEFEALLFSNIERFEYVLDGWNDDVKQQLQNIRTAFATPEEINNSKETAPSKRILAAFAPGTYSKTEHGPIIAEEIGLETIRQECPEFNNWVQAMESLVASLDK